jgi:hypothetical protein
MQAGSIHHAILELPIPNNDLFSELLLKFGRIFRSFVVTQPKFRSSDNIAWTKHYHTQRVFNIYRGPNLLADV